FGLGVYFCEVAAHDQARHRLGRVMTQAGALHRAWLVDSARIWLTRSLVGSGSLTSEYLDGLVGDVERWGAPFPDEAIHDLHPPLPALALAEIRLAQNRTCEAARLAEEGMATAVSHARTLDEVLAGEIQVRLLLQQ